MKDIRQVKPKHPNGGEQFLTFNGSLFECARFHIDPNDGEEWWQSDYDTKPLKGITHWDYLPAKP